MGSELEELFADDLSGLPDVDLAPEPDTDAALAELLLEDDSVRELEAACAEELSPYAAGPVALPTGLTRFSPAWSQALNERRWQHHKGKSRSEEQLESLSNAWDRKQKNKKNK